MSVLKSTLLLSFIICHSHWNIMNVVFCSRELAGDGFTDEQSDNIVKVINKWRSEVVPTAANLHAVTYSKERGEEAKVFTDKCQIPRLEEPNAFGESWYFSWTSQEPDKSASHLLAFHTKYYYNNDLCDPNAKNCEFFKNLLSDQLFWIGCSRNNACHNKTNFTELTVCATEYRNLLRPIYVAGPSCSRCTREMGSMCHERLCVKKEDCSKLNCTCETKCTNCGEFNADACQCECRYGYDWVDCSGNCSDENMDCQKVVGYGYNWTDDKLTYHSQKGRDACQQNLMVRSRWCRKTCGTCRQETEFVQNDPLTHRCCPDLVCSSRDQIPNFKKCVCEDKLVSKKTFGVKPVPKKTHVTKPVPKITKVTKSVRNMTDMTKPVLNMTVVTQPVHNMTYVTQAVLNNTDVTKPVHNMTDVTQAAGNKTANNNPVPNPIPKDTDEEPFNIDDYLPEGYCPGSAENNNDQILLIIILTVYFVSCYFNLFRFILL